MYVHFLAEEAVPFGRDVHCIKQTRPRPGPTMNSISAHDAHGVAPLSHDQLVSENSQLRQMLSNMEEEMQKRPKNEWDSQVVLIKTFCLVPAVCSNLHFSIRFPDYQTNIWYY